MFRSRFLTFVVFVSMLVALVPLSQPAAAGDAHDWDGVTVESFKRTLKTRGVGLMIDAALGALFGAEASELSLLWFLFYLNSTVADSAYQTWAHMTAEAPVFLPPERFHFQVHELKQ